VNFLVFRKRLELLERLERLERISSRTEPFLASDSKRFSYEAREESTSGGVLL